MAGVLIAGETRGEAASGDHERQRYAQMLHVVSMPEP
jgi:hypothetical protein